VKRPQPRGIGWGCHFTSAGGGPNQIKDELHFGHPTSAVWATTGIPGRSFQDVSAQGNGSVPKKHAAGIAIHVPAALDPNWATEMPSQPIKSNAYAKHVTKRFVRGARASPGSLTKARLVGMFRFIAAEPVRA